MSHDHWHGGSIGIAVRNRSESLSAFAGIRTPATKALDPDPFPCRSLRHAVYAALLHFGLETAQQIGVTCRICIIGGRDRYCCQPPAARSRRATGSWESASRSLIPEPVIDPDPHDVLGEIERDRPDVVIEAVRW
jgi:hypothetical protein